MHSANDFTFSDISEGTTYSGQYKIEHDIYDVFTSVFHDRSPVHVDNAYAKASGFDGCVMHGAILNGFLSHFIGMSFPGRRALLLSVNMNYHRPSYLDDEIELTAVVRQKVESTRVIVLNVKFVNSATQILVASGKIQVAVRND
jgi:acyl dehydratase